MAVFKKAAIFILLYLTPYEYWQSTILGARDYHPLTPFLLSDFFSLAEPVVIS